jgi:hypothetical protein
LHAKITTSRDFAEFRSSMQGALDRHLKFFNDAPVSTQERVLMEMFAHVRDSDLPIETELERRAAHWWSGRRLDLVAQYSSASASKLRVLNGFLESQAMMPDASNLFDGSLMSAWLRFVHERYGQRGTDAIRSASGLYELELQRFRASWSSLPARRKLWVLQQWNRGLRSPEMLTPRATARWEISELEVIAFVAWSRGTARDAWRSMLDELAAPRESESEPLRRLRIACSADQLEREARYWWLDKHRDTILALGGVDSADRTPAEILGIALREDAGANQGSSASPEADRLRVELLKELSRFDDHVRRRAAEQAELVSRTLTGDERVSALAIVMLLQGPRGERR